MRDIKELGSRKLDDEWVYLILQARKIGLKPDEVRKFLSNAINSRTAKDIRHGKADF
ncbi:anti-repressor SinI family protein [Oceanobacillus sp. Castelsardo]|uniref:anti-repressor SinI family protein n=1 Tax=Oceanobacillus sp. Castelsardo TaxID=1851204 RepID=UPI0009EDD07E|nr:anti-repressor SinI family protein [Oceanobacillus sp. Castelsardo]